MSSNSTRAPWSHVAENPNSITTRELELPISDQAQFPESCKTMIYDYVGLVNQSPEFNNLKAQDGKPEEGPKSRADPALPNTPVIRDLPLKCCTITYIGFLKIVFYINRVEVHA